MSSNSDTGASSDRRHDLDALRAFAMFLGIALHASMSFFPGPWMVHDTRQSWWFALFTGAVHGFRMPLFFLLSGYFTMMMYRKRGLRALLAQRALRILVPCLVGLVTIMPLMYMASMWAIRTASRPAGKADDDLFDAIRSENLSAIRKFLESGSNVSQPDSLKIRPMHWACLVGNQEIVELLLERGADVNQGNGEGNTPLHIAAFMGNDELVEFLLQKGANAAATNRDRSLALAATTIPVDVTRGILGFLNLPIPQKSDIEQGRSRVKQRLEPLTTALAQSTKPSDSTAEKGPLEKLVVGYSSFMRSDVFRITWGGTSIHLVHSLTFGHLWFLWFLCWFIGFFAITVRLSSLFQRHDITPQPTTTIRWYFLCLMPFAILPQWFMGGTLPNFGPDTSLGILPLPHVLLYYGIFFAFGSLYYDVHDRQAKLGRHWWILLPLGLLVVFPAGAATMGQRLPATIIQPLFAWFMSIGMMGLFHAVLNKPSPWVRYLSDASYWLYLAHPPLVITAQAMVRGWQWPAIVKFTLIVGVVTLLLLLTYQWFVRYTWIGLVLNGRRQRSS